MEIEEELQKIPGYKTGQLHPKLSPINVTLDELPELRTINLIGTTVSEANTQNHDDQIRVYREYAHDIQLQEQQSLNAVIEASEAAAERQKIEFEQKLTELDTLQKEHLNKMEALEDEYRTTMRQLIDQQVAKLLP